MPKSGRATPTPRLDDAIYLNVCASQGRIVVLATPDGDSPKEHMPYAPNTVELRSRPLSENAQQAAWERPSNAKRPTSTGASEIEVNACTGEGGVLTDDNGQTSFWSGRNGGEWQAVTPAGSAPGQSVIGGAIATDGDAVIVGDSRVYRLDTTPNGLPSAWTSAPLPRAATDSGPVSHLQAVAGSRVFILAVPSKIAGANTSAGEPSIYEVNLP